jgi:two-component system sensor histidine kinase AlgZ
MSKFLFSFSQGANERATIGIVSVALFSFMFWIGVGIFFAMALRHDDPNEGLNSSYVMSFLRVAVYFVPLAFMNSCLAVLFWYRATVLLQPKTLLLNAILLLLVGVPVQSMFETLLQLLQKTEPLKSFWRNWLNFSAFSLWLIVCFLLLMYFSQVAFAIWRRNLESELELANSENEGVELRLHLLQGQLKPHFLFNALNSIGALVRGADRQLAARALKQLSGLLSYVAHASKQEWLTVAEEIRFVRDYVEMQNLRFGDRMHIEWEIQAQSWEQIPCAPLLFQPLIENAIHHGVELHHEKCHVKIELRVLDEYVHFTVINSVFSSISARKGHGLGLSATKERIALLYGDQAQLATSNAEEQFIARLVFPKKRVWR